MPRKAKNDGGFRGFDNSIDHNSDSVGFCSYILESLDGSDRKFRNKKRMTKAEAASRTELVNACKKVGFAWLFAFLTPAITINSSNTCFLA